jgi:Luciferase-like monooxygenase
MQIGIDSFVEISLDPSNGGGAPDQAKRVRDLLEEIELADQVGLEVFGIGEHHRQEFVASAPPVFLAAAAARTKRMIKGQKGSWRILVWSNSRSFIWPLLFLLSAELLIKPHLD